ncbi:SapC family protein [Burkholderia pyrrocinia]|uniref:SapC family protein n=1 Tax=Burkholderia pyrrocinia TaxID=60550 RepID=UPI001BCAC8FD|nr:SapC family protein [Burkholderia pyrrocinia]QVN23369.1 SapC family protein [Burkholderia pyrrocinia]
MLTIQPPFGYHSLKPLNRADHVRLLQPGELPPFARESQIVPLSFSEVVAAAWHYPIVFLHDAQTGGHTLAALLGLAQNHNAFGGDAGWEAGAYVPAYVRRYPFCMASVNVDGKADPDLLVCVEADRASAEGVDGAEQLFDAEGQPGPRWAAIEAFLKEYEADLAASRAFTQRLAELDLLEPFTANIVRPGDAGQCTVGGMVRVNEARLAALDAETVASLHRSGHLSRIYIHLFSLQRFYRLIEREAEQGIYAASTPAEEAKDVESAAAPTC